jgi:hypothetical protein
LSGVNVNTYLGNQSTVDPLMQAAESGYTQSYPGVAYIVVQWTTTHYSGWPSVIIKGRGKKVYTGGVNPSPVYSETPAWQWWDFIADVAQLSLTNDNYVSLLQLALTNQETVVTEARRQSGLVIDVARPAREWIEVLAMYAGAFVRRRVDAYLPVPDRPISAVTRPLSGDDFEELNFEIVIADPLDVPNSVHIIYSDTSLDVWTEAEAISTDANAGTIDNPVRDSYVRMPGITRYSQAIREANERREKLAVGSLGLRGTLIDRHFDLEVGDVVSITDRAFDSVAVLFRITLTRILGIGSLQIEASRYDPSVYNDSEETFTGLTRPKVIGETS